MAQLCQHEAELRRLNTAVYIVSFSASPLVMAWLQETGAPFPVLLDRDRAVYRAYGLERSWLRSGNLRTMWRYVRLIAAGRQWRGIQDDPAQLGGDFVVDSTGIVRLAYRSYDPTDRPPVSELLSLLRQLAGSEKGDSRAV